MSTSMQEAKFDEYSLQVLRGLEDAMDALSGHLILLDQKEKRGIDVTADRRRVGGVFVQVMHAHRDQLRHMNVKLEIQQELPF